MYKLPMTKTSAIVRSSSGRAGVTLVELMVVIMLLGTGLLVSVLSFGGIQKSLQYSKGRTLAANIAQEKMQIIMQKSYYEVLVTTTPYFIVEPSTTVYYDAGYFPPEPIPEGGMNFTRYTYIQVAYEDAVTKTIQTLSPDTPDTGMRLITITVVWKTDTGDRLLTIQNVLNNPNTVMSNSVLSGVVKDNATLNPISNAVVDAAENIGWRSTTSNTGNYLINLSPGTFDFQASAPGYFPQIITKSILPNNNSLDFSLKAISTGTVKGSAWLTNHVVISQVVASTGPSNNVEYVELYNPTTGPIALGVNAGGAYATPNTWIVVMDAASPTNIQQRELVYISTYIPAGAFYLITNTGDGNGASAAIHCDTITVQGVTLNPDACWRFVGGTSPNYNHTLQCNPITSSGCGPGNFAGGIWVGTNGGAAWTGFAGTTQYDAIVWDGNGLVPPYAETAAAHSANNGMNPNENFIRRLDTTTAWNTSYGNAYDSNNNSIDFVDNPTIQFPPRTSTTLKTPLTGTPAIGAIASMTDGISTPSSTTIMGAGTYASPTYAQFLVPSVATGTWTIFIDSGTSSAEIDSVLVLANSTTTVPNSATSPIWQNNSQNIVLSTAGVVGTITGKVTDALGNIISPGITVTAGNAVVTTNANGMYFIRLSTGVYDVVANPGNANALYASMTYNPPQTVTLGDVTLNVNFQLPKGGRINGWISRDGINPLPGITLVAYDSDGIPRDSEVSAFNGSFMLVNLTTGTYTIQPVLDPKETSSPVSVAPSILFGGTTVWSSSFTVVGAMGTVIGAVKLSGQPIRSGVLIVASTATISFPLPALSSSTMAGSVIYADSSLEDGTYSLDIRGSTTSVYNMAAFYTTMSGSTPVVSTKTVSGVTVTSGQRGPTVNFLW